MKTGYYRIARLIVHLSIKHCHMDYSNLAAMNKAGCLILNLFTIIKTAKLDKFLCDAVFRRTNSLLFALHLLVPYKSVPIRNLHYTSAQNCFVIYMHICDLDSCRQTN